MALLTADDVLNKKFQATKFREGYDQDEVDDFLDEVVTTLRAATAENEELKSKLAAAERRIAELSRGQGGEPSGPAAPEASAEAGAAPSPEPTARPDGSEPETASPGASGPATSQDAPAPDAAPEKQPHAEQQVRAAAVPQETVTAPATQQSAPSAERRSEPESAAGMLALAQKLHDDYVRSGREEGDRILEDAREQAARIVSEAEDTSSRTLSQLEQERSLLERKIDELRVFERDYRTRLKTYLENLLGDLDARAAAVAPRGGGDGAQP